MSRPSVALLSLSLDDSSPVAGGTERACAQLVRLTHQRVEYVVISAALPHDLVDAVHWRRVPLPRRPAFVRDVLFFVLGGLRLLTVHADVRHTMGAIVPNKTSIATVHFCHAAFRGSGSRGEQRLSLVRRISAVAHRQFAELAERWVYRPSRSGRLVAVSDGVAAELRAHFPRCDVTVVPNGVDVERFRPDEVARQSVRSELPGTDEDLVVLFVGGDWGRKGLETAIRAVGLTAATGLPVRLWVVGSGDSERYRAIAAAADAPVTFVGHRSDVERFYAAADVLLLPSAYETFSLVAYEAAASGLPIVGTEVSGIVELVRDGGGGLLTARDPVALADALTRVAPSDVRMRLGAAARGWVSRFTWEAAADATLELYRRASEAKPL